MKTKQEIEKMKDGIQQKISEYEEKSNSLSFGSDDRDAYNHLCIKYKAQYNILLEVLK